tara:strand:- start:1087 stop:1281 length:195 start_codon:yes stop_codon:yes gene_type:complete
LLGAYKRYKPRKKGINKMLSVNGLIIMFMFGYMLATIVEAVKQDLKARKDIKELKNIFPTVWKD